MTLITRNDRTVEPIVFVLPPLPPSWNAAHVGLRMAEAFAVLKWLPTGGDRMRSSLQTKWPSYVYGFEDKAAQQEGDVQDAEHPRLRFSPVEIDNMNSALAWPLIYLRHHPELAEAVNAVARAYSLGLDAGAVAKERGGYADDWRMRHDEGCERIAVGLIRDRVRVF